MKIRKLIAAALSLVMLGGAVTYNAPALREYSITAYAVDNPCDKQDNKEVPYDGSKWIQPTKWDLDPIDPDEYTGNAKVWFDKVTIPYDEAAEKAKKGEPITVNLNVSGAANTVFMIIFHRVFHDTRLKVVPNYNGKVLTKGGALIDFDEIIANHYDGQYEFSALARDDILRDGVIFSIDLKLPENVKPGDLYPIGLQYYNDGYITDMFDSEDRDYDGKLQMAYIFTKGIENGYIAVDGTPASADIRFDAYGGSGTMAKVSAEVGSEYTLPECTFTPPMGKKFKGWGWNDNSTATNQPGDKVTVEKEQNSVYAIWEYDYSHSDIEFRSHGGSGSMSYVKVPINSEYTFPACGFTPPEGLSFVGWKWQSLSNTAIYQPGDKVKCEMTLNSVYAIWSLASGTIDNNLTWTYDSTTDALTISGEGDMADFKAPEDRPWHRYRFDVSTITLDTPSMKHIGSYAFERCYAKEIIIPEQVTTIGERAFYGDLIKSVIVPESVTQIGAEAFAECKLKTIEIRNPNCELADGFLTNNNHTVEVDGKETYFTGTIYGYDGSTAEAYAAANNIKFESLGAPLCGKDLKWEYDTETKTLTITGTGDMFDYESPDKTPWYKYREELEHIVFPEGMTSVGDFAFTDQYAVKEITLPETVTKIGVSAFEKCSELTDITIMDPDAQIDASQWTICNMMRPTADGYRAAFRGTIHGYTGSTAQAYAEKYGYSFAALMPKISFDANGGTGEMAAAETEPGEYTLPECGFTAPDNFAFAGWKLGDTVYAPGDKIEVTAALLLEAQWKRSHYTVSFDANGGTGTMKTVKAEADKAYTLPENSFTAPTGKGFGGWEIDSKTYQPGTKVTVSADLTLTAHWVDSVTVTFASNGGTGEMEAVVCTDYDYTLPECGFTAPANKQFAGWFVGGEVRQPGDKITLTGDIKLYAIWDVSLNTVKIDANGAKGSIADFVLLSGTSFVFPTCTLTAPEGKYFAGWQLGAKTYQTGDSAVITKNVTVKALWETIQFTVTFDANGGSGEMASKTVAPETEYTFAKCAFTAPDGAEFLGWQVGDKTYEVGDTLVITADTVITALWSEPAETVLIGDANSDGTVDAKDAMLLARYVAKWDGIAPDLRACDLNGDGKADNADAMILARYTAGWEGYDKYIVSKTV